MLRLCIQFTQLRGQPPSLKPGTHKVDRFGWARNCGGHLSHLNVTGKAYPDLSASHRLPISMPGGIEEGAPASLGSSPSMKRTVRIRGSKSCWSRAQLKFIFGLVQGPILETRQSGSRAETPFNESAAGQDSCFVRRNTLPVHTGGLTGLAGPAVDRRSIPFR